MFGSGVEENATRAGASIIAAAGFIKYEEYTGACSWVHKIRGVYGSPRVICGLGIQDVNTILQTI